MEGRGKEWDGRQDPEGVEDIEGPEDTEDSEDLDLELRRLFRDDRLDLAPEPGAGERILAGARRARRRRRVLISSAAALSMVGVVASGLVLGQLSTPAEDPRAQIAAPADADRAGASDPVSPTVFGSSLGEGRAGQPAAPGSDLPREPTVTDSAAPERTWTTASPPRSPITTSGPVLGHEGYKPLTLGMRFERAEATGMLVEGAEPPPPDGTCMRYALAEGADAIEDVVISAEHGVVGFNAAKVQTAEGVGVGSPVERLRASYENLTVEDDGYSAAVGSGRYRFAVSDGTVMRLRLLADPWPC